MNSKIKIGVSAKFNSKAPVFYGETKRHIQYVETHIAKWIARNDGLPFLIPSETDVESDNHEYLDPTAFSTEMDALLLQGGVDVHPSFYGQESPSGNYPYDLARDKYELRLIQSFIKQRKPIFGICRGLQLLNVYFGGSLHENLHSDQFQKHFDQELEERNTHKILIKKESILSEYFGDEELVNSIHHQGINRLGEGLNVEAVAEDGLVEAISRVDADHFIFAVQWHPEFHEATEIISAENIFRLFLNSAKNRKYFGRLKSNKPQKVKMPASNSLSLGVELELQLLNSTTLDLDPSAPKILSAVKNKSGKIKNEIFQSMIEIETSICSDANEVESDLAATFKILSDECKIHDLKICALGTHPFARYSDRLLTDSERYQYLIESRQWIARRIAIFGLHCHVGTSTPDEAIHLYRLYLSLAPLLLAISASSPFFQSEMTGLNSVRSTFFESTPAGGHPPIINSWNEFEGILAKLYRSKSITSPKDLWWDVRPSLNYGTIEIRICDMMPTINENACLIALIHLLGHCFLKYRNEYFWPALSEWSYRENKWRALRYGIGFEYIVGEDGSTINSRKYLADLLNDFRDDISALRYTEKLEYLLGTMLLSNPAQRISAEIDGGSSFYQILKKYSV